MRLIRQGQRQQLVYQMAGSGLALGNARQLFAPHLRIGVAQAVISQGTNACQGRAQLMRHVARELALRPHAESNAPQQGVDRLPQTLHVARAARHGHRREVTGITLPQSLL